MSQETNNSAPSESMACGECNGKGQKRIQSSPGSWMQCSDCDGSGVASQPVAAPGATIQTWQARIAERHPTSEAQYWPVELKCKYMEAEIADLRAIAQQAEAAPAPTAEPVTWNESWKVVIGAAAALARLAIEDDAEREAMMAHVRKIVAAIPKLDASPAAHPANTEDDENIEADAYMYACDLMEQFQRERAKRGVEIGTQGSLCDGIAWLYDKLKKLESASPAATEATNQPLSEFERRCLHPTCTGSCEDCYYSQRITHRDDAALEIFVKACKAKMAKGRSKGRGGWEDPNQCPAGRLQGMLLDHLEKGDPLDVALFCMMLWMRGAPVVAVNFKAKLQAALEDAATICDNFATRDMHPAECASAIRMMKGSIK